MEVDPRERIARQGCIGLFLGLFTGGLGAACCSAPYAWFFERNILNFTIIATSVVGIALMLIFAVVAIRDTRCPKCNRWIASIITSEQKRYVEKDIAPLAVDQTYVNIVDYKCRFCNHQWRDDKSETYREVFYP